MRRERETYNKAQSLDRLGEIYAEVKHLEQHAKPRLQKALQPVILALIHAEDACYKSRKLEIEQ